MPQVLFNDSLGNLEITGNSTISLNAAASVGELRVTLGGQQYTSSSALAADISGNGVGGLDTGSAAANTLYYVYAILDSGSLALVVSAAAPSVGPTGFTNYVLVAACLTDPSANLSESADINKATPILAEIYLGTTQTGVTTAITTIELDTVIKDTADAWDAGSFEYIVPEDGEYELVGSMEETSTTSNARAQFSIEVDGTPVAIDRHSTDSTSSTNTTFLTTKTIQLSSGEAVSITTENVDDSSYNVLAGRDRTYLTVRKVSGGISLKDL